MIWRKVIHDETVTECEECGQSLPEDQFVFTHEERWELDEGIEEALNELAIAVFKADGELTAVRIKGPCPIRNEGVQVFETAAGTVMLELEITRR